MEITKSNKTNKRRQEERARAKRKRGGRAGRGDVTWATAGVTAWYSRIGPSEKNRRWRCTGRQRSGSGHGSIGEEQPGEYQRPFRSRAVVVVPWSWYSWYTTKARILPAEPATMTTTLPGLRARCKSCCGKTSSSSY